MCPLSVELSVEHPARFLWFANRSATVVCQLMCDRSRSLPIT